MQVDVDTDAHVNLNTPDSEVELMSLYIMTLHPVCLSTILNCHLFINDDTIKQAVHETDHYCVSTDTLSLAAFPLCCYLQLISYPLFCNKLFNSRREPRLPGCSRVLRSRPDYKNFIIYYQKILLAHYFVLQLLS
jgi:hypothetical protein